MEYYVAFKTEIKEALYVLIWNNLQNVLLTEQSKVHNNVSSILYLHKRKGRGKNI